MCGYSDKQLVGVILNSKVLKNIKSITVVLCVVLLFFCTADYHERLTVWVRSHWDRLLVIIKMPLSFLKTTDINEVIIWLSFFIWIVCGGFVLLTNVLDWIEDN